uniref:Uncharacterized protein n=1 Tax=viral metagenome TaxID=1070528 RepID=A0A6C0BTJ4_9ZZZZ
MMKNLIYNNIRMLKRLNKLEKQYGGAIPFSAMKRSGSMKKDGGKTLKKSKKRSTKKTKHKKRSISPGRVHRKITKKTRRSKKKTQQKKSKQCSCSNHKYTGKEDTPTGLGKCSECIPLNVVMKGKDNNLYENTKDGWIKIN